MTRYVPPASQPPRATFAPVVAAVPLTIDEERRLRADRRLVDGIHCEFLSERERLRLVLLDWLIQQKRHGGG